LRFLELREDWMKMILRFEIKLKRFVYLRRKEKVQERESEQKGSTE
jgi:hypothetical protein